MILFIQQARSPLKFGAMGDHAGVMRQGEFAASNKAVFSQKESDTIFGKYLYPSVLKQQPGDHCFEQWQLDGPSHACGFAHFCHAG